jgi:hypothetical protein
LAEAERVIRDFVEAVDKKIDELGFRMNDARRRDVLLSSEHSLRLFSYEQAKKKGSEVVEGIHVRKTVKHSAR